ncbi:toxin-antitoxin system YwqK family antitoxin [Fusobacterium polymorphum]|uniref:toxin-antitoxin system YwqK family antitoxin n=1 Tax=Fusobacterium nucleatum subsp. polymorphum TaxID=76857 RepID=UPI003008B6B5
MFIIILSTLLSSCLAINEFLAESEVRNAKKISHYAPVVEETRNTALVQTFENGKILYYDGTYINGKKNGTEKEYYMSGKLQSATTYKNDIPEETIMYYPNGKVYMKRNYNKTYEITYYYENGQIFLSGYVKNNSAYGEWKYYDKKGKLVTKGEYNKISKAFETVFGENLKKTLKNN